MSSDPIPKPRSTAWASLLVVVGLSCAGSEPSGTPHSSKPWAGRLGITEVDAPADEAVVASQLVYLPAYSHVNTADNRQPLNLAVTVFVRNTDPGRPIILTRVEYFDSGGQSIRQYLPRPLKVSPLATVDFFVKESDLSGGASPSFLVRWVATEAVSSPLVESVMIGTSGTQGISFTGSGRVIDSRKP